MTVQWYQPKHAMTIAKLDCILQKSEAMGSCTLDEMHTFVITFRTLPLKHQRRYAMLLDMMGELFDEEEQPCR